MGRVVTLARLPTSNIAGGIESSPITKGETQEMAAEYIRIAPRARWTATVPGGSDWNVWIVPDGLPDYREGRTAD